ncbi:radical SAM protein [bacterium]|nr:radical SAM protein [bacterium]MBQ9149411.1 radical SAM protein [bacterium]
MAKDNKMLLLFPPQWTPISPHFAICTLLGQLKANGYNVSFMDLNIEFYNKILSRDYLQFIREKIGKDYLELFTTIRKMYTREKKEKKYSLDETCKMYKFNKLRKFVSANTENYDILPNVIPLAIDIIKNEERFFNPERLINAMNYIDMALEMVSLAYAPTNIGFDSCFNPFLKLDFESIKHFVFDRDSNIFWDFFKNKIQEIKNQDPSFIAISLNSSSQLVAGLTLTYLLKKYTKAHINIGGNFFGRIKETLLKRPEFAMFCDSISIEEGEGPIIEMARYVNGEISLDKVPNLVWFKNKKVFLNEKMEPVRLNCMANLNLDYHKLDEYFTPKIVLPYQTSRGCYWGKCTFCDQYFGMEYNVKEIDKVISEMKELKEKYGITHYEFIDESVSPIYLKEFSNELLKTDIKPSFFCDARLETAFDESVFDVASKAGLKMAMWGLESGSDKVMESIKKGIDLDKRFDILKAANKYGIWNFAFIFFGYPLETKEDARKTIVMLCDNHEIINSYGRSVFSMGKHAKVALEPEKYGITKIFENEEEFSPSINFECIGMKKEELSEILKECREECFKHYKNPLWMFLRYREWLFLYIDKLGLEKVSKTSVNVEQGQ